MFVIRVSLTTLDNVDMAVGRGFKELDVRLPVIWMLELD